MTQLRYVMCVMKCVMQLCHEPCHQLRRENAKNNLDSSEKEMF